MLARIAELLGAATAVQLFNIKILSTLVETTLHKL